ncbi:DUF1871 family protein [Lacrimispora aerotolerans]|uniref:DUF1871 family protein n=1 Tax=Lacrimispora aerotolerans TaxID=36832 RepID=UPI00047E8F00|nr:DUF1871 family protein [Lacrimispora aerotolerans]
MKEKVAKIINDWDPIDLFPYSPKDEYEMEIDLISKLLDESTDLEHIANCISTVFTSRFGDDVFTKKYNECFNIAKKILYDSE